MGELYNKNISGVEVSESVSKRKQLLNLAKKVIMSLSARGYLRFLPDTVYLKLLYRMNMGKKLNLRQPETFNEKLQWLKIHDRKPEYTNMVDKYEAKVYASNVIGEEYIIPTLGIWERVEDIDFTKLPSQFVLKCTHDSGGIAICKDRRQFDRKKTFRKLRKCLKANFYWIVREWPYKNVKPRIIAEPYMTDGTGELVDYKVHCFHGKPEFILYCSKRFSKEGLHEDFFTTDWKRLNMARPGHPNSKESIDPPVNLDKMLEFSERFAKNIPFCRVDFYEIKGKLYFGEVTFYPASGFQKFSPEKWDLELGKKIKL